MRSTIALDKIDLDCAETVKAKHIQILLPTQTQPNLLVNC